MSVRIKVFQGSAAKSPAHVDIAEGSSVARVLRSMGLLDQPCGAGKCGKCLVFANTTPLVEEVCLLDAAALDSGLRLACYLKAAPGLEIRIPDPGTVQVLLKYAEMSYPFESFIRRVPVQVKPSTLAEQRTDLCALLDACGAKTVGLTLAQLQTLPEFLRNGGPHSALLREDTLCGFTTEKASYGLIVDIGTTTVAALLVDLEQQQVVALRGERNAQSPFGADVISRIQRTMEEGTEPLRVSIVRQINDLLQSLLQEMGASDITLAVLTGNTTMMHMVCGISAEHIGKAPFIPVTTAAIHCCAHELGLTSLAPTVLLPGISSYIGADIVAALLAAGAHLGTEPFLLVDFGTNAETVLFTGTDFYACSAAAGPCFEGASLSCGMPGQSGALNALWSTEDGFGFSTIDNTEIKGICGSGIVDAIAVLLEAGAIEETGSFTAEAEMPLGFRKAIDSSRGFCLSERVHITQKDIREIQLGKAAVRAGIEVLLASAGMKTEELGTLYLAGGFGSALNAGSAARIGLIPESLEKKVRVLGNAACFGALRYATEKNAAECVAEIIKRTKYIELSSHSGFAAHYVEQMMFPAQTLNAGK